MGRNPDWRVVMAYCVNIRAADMVIGEQSRKLRRQKQSHFCKNIEWKMIYFSALDPKLFYKLLKEMQIFPHATQADIVLANGSAIHR